MTTSEQRLIPDTLLRELIAAGHVDLLVGVPTLNHADRIGEVVRAVHAAFLTHFPRQRAVLLNADGGSIDGTPDIVRHTRLDGEAGARTVGLRTAHRITTPYHALSGTGSALNLLFAAADLMQASTVVVLDADLRGITPARVAALAAPALREQVDLVAPAYRRQAGDGLLVTQLLRPLIDALYGWTLDEPVVTEFGCSGRFTTHCRAQPAWSSDTNHDTPGCWLTCEALASGHTTCQVDMGTRRFLPNRPPPALSDVFSQTVGAAFAAIVEHAAYWQGRSGREVVRTIPHPSAEAPAPDDTGAVAERLTASFAEDVRNLRDILRTILGRAHVAALRAASTHPAGERYPDDLWAATVAGFLLAFHRGIMRRDHIVQALHPLYAARAGSFLLEHGQAPPEALAAADEALCASFERMKLQLVDRWHQPA